MQMQAQENPENPERHRVCLRAAGDVGSVQSADDDQYLIRAGWTKLGEWIEDDPAEYAHIDEPNTPEGPKITAVGSMEWRHANRKKSYSPQSRGGRKGEEEIGPRGHISRQEIVKAFFPLRCDIAGDRAAKRFRRAAAANPETPHTDAAVMVLDSALIATIPKSASMRCQWSRSEP